MSGRNTDAHAAAMQELLDVIDALLGPGGCPWDQEQTPESMCDYLVEEAFELIDGIRRGDRNEAKEELGDVFFILLFIATLYERAGGFTLTDSLRHSAAKMIRRHPHVFDDTTFGSIQELWDNWERTKRKENEGSDRKRVFDSLPAGLPPLLKAYRINSKAARNNFTWKADQDVQIQLESEWREWQEAMAEDDQEAAEREFGDYLFTLVELGRRKGIKANAALDFANQKFLRRFAAMEELAEMRGLTFSDLDLDAMNTLWDEVKTQD
ncbi:MAG: nucleoside triphosphate pyrophosphohydrolase [Pseudodesulfovibrio sp.]|uniref:MazG family protein n=1 Tax=Pseudodesulfovibrio aespoeensis (strain ATCC 700646 / DSM 10631 / Aspo-2) TaxID=643562 RepID=E6VS71_PSEA9|nr:MULTISPECIES: nucleoside triphosphate pyrophosphohydrolase [Pseudodesulfovibrio]MBU4192918.1 nucleoside triphosphate pyrophosphohydrolase [Pseudomonadota bacterium]ADU63116.1 MazG family protein [Pseudodesulfovibrio aespoeensis Aspo-2]MBU4244321.1 nucleoside triphosphate pyrophosphohydrolase [Pseudomonadota bacterium]MBU4379036.1 nucleoside triphosphate pyrophosphohydrolase [Pseudomonadota bacterium]MBU4474108.1 nucleoside triphosphate pyrophosphohydrolase [Pseudomonadota bacterium]